MTPFGNISERPRLHVNARDEASRELHQADSAVPENRQLEAENPSRVCQYYSEVRKSRLTAAVLNVYRGTVGYLAISR